MGLLLSDKMEKALEKTIADVQGTLAALNPSLVKAPAVFERAERLLAKLEHELDEARKLRERLQAAFAPPK